MKHIIFVRHGKAEKSEPESPDYPRNLVERGQEDARSVAKYVNLLGLAPDILISSPAPRALQTARIFAEETGYVKRSIVTRKAMYDQQPGALYEILRTVDDDRDTVMLVGHNPSIEETAGEILSESGLSLPTSGVAAVKCTVKSWADIDSGTGKLIAAFSPGKLPALGKSKLFRTYVEQQIEDAIHSVLFGIDEKAAKKTRKKIGAAVESISSRFTKNI